jgi:hypothetical protein
VGGTQTPEAFPAAPCPCSDFRVSDASTHDELLRALRAQGRSKLDSIRLLRAETGLSLADAKRVVLDSPVWADQRAGVDSFRRVLFIECVVNGIPIDEPPDRAAECRERQQRAAALLRDLAEGMPDGDAAQYRESMARNAFGDAFAALVAAGRQHDLPDRYWHALADIARTLCLDELLGDDAPAPEDDDFVHAAYEVRRRTGAL